jgi:uncharacterized protein YigE (DUF2233 family)
LLCAIGGVLESSAAEIARKPVKNGTIRSCHIDLRRDEVRMFWRDEQGAAFGNFERLRQSLRRGGTEIVCATNGGMYMEDLSPLGLYIENERVMRKLNTRKGAYGNFYLEPNGVFVVEDRRARIIATDQFRAELDKPANGVRFATQSGPMMIVNGKINSVFSPTSANRLIRNAVCVVSPQEVVLAISETAVSFYEFSQFLRDSLQCRDALHLDSTVSQFIPTDRLQVGPLFGVIIAVTHRAP